MRKAATTRFLQDNHPVMPGGNFRSAIRGDYFYNSFNVGMKMIIDVKNYSSSQGIMKLPGFKKEDYIKGTDSNLKYSLFYEIKLFDFVDNSEADIEKLRDFYFGDMNEIEKFKDYFLPKYSAETTIAFMTPSNFNDLFCFMENGFAWKYSEVMPLKGFFSKVENTIEFKVIDFGRTIKSSIIEVKMKIDNRGYVYIMFYDGKDCIYIISQRGWTGIKKFTSNCSFINKKYMELVSKVDIPTDIST